MSQHNGMDSIKIFLNMRGPIGFSRRHFCVDCVTWFLFGLQWSNLTVFFSNKCHCIQHKQGQKVFIYPHSYKLHYCQCRLTRYLVINLYFAFTFPVLLLPLISLNVTSLDYIFCVLPNNKARRM